MAEYRQPGPHAVAIIDGEWHDPARDRQLRWRRYQPHPATGIPAPPSGTPKPYVVHSHGLGGSRACGIDWLTHWASWGIVAVAVQHPGSDEAALPSDSPLALRHLLRSATDAGQLALRQHDLLFALDRLAGEGAVAFGVSGHSFGAVSAQRLIGERRGRDDLPADPRVAAAILFSPSARGGTLPHAERFAGIAVPCLHLTGSRDEGIGPGDISAADRSLPFTHMPPPHKQLLVLDGAGHPDFAGRAGLAAAPQHRSLLKAASTAFWHAHLLLDQTAAAWLNEELPHLLSTADRFERK